VRAADDSSVRSVLISLTLVVGGCATVTHTQTLDTEAGRAWLNEAADHRITVDSPGDVTVTGRIAAATAGTVHLRGEDGGTIQISVRNGATLRERKRGTGAILGALAGIGCGVVTGALLTEALSTPNPDSAGGREHPPLLIPLGALAGALVGAIIGAVVGSERRLEVHANTGSLAP